MLDIFTKWKYTTPWYSLIFGVTSLVLVSRRPDAILRPQFFAEDGFLWYAQAYNQGAFISFFEPVAGYFQTLARIGGAVAQVVPLIYAPLVMNLVAVAVQVLPVLLVFSKRFETIIPSWLGRFCLVLIYLLLFNSQETHLNITNAQWYLAISAFLILVMPSATTRAGEWFDRGLLVLSGLSGPFAIMLYPVALYLHWKLKSNRTWIHSTILAVTASIQLLSVVLTGRGSSTLIHNAAPLEVLNGLFQVFHRQVVWGLLSGRDGYLWFTQTMPGGAELAVLITITMLGLLIYASYSGSIIIRSSLLFAATIFLTSTLFPTIQLPTDQTSWQVLSNAYGIRYWLIPCLVLASTVLWASSRQQPKYLKVVAGAALLLLTFFWLKYYRYRAYYQFTPYADLQFAQQVKVFEQQPAGTEFTIHHPPIPWSMKLVKK